MVTSGMPKLLGLEAVWWLGGHLEPRRMPKKQSQRAKFEEEGGGRVSGSLNREGHGTQTELYVWRQGWGHLRAGVNLLLPSLAKDVLSFVFWRQGHQTQRTDGKERGGPCRASRPPLHLPDKRRIPVCLSSKVGKTGERVQLGTEKRMPGSTESWTCSEC